MSNGFEPVADIVLAHHERIDGSGYPNGVAGDEIPILSRIISIADTYDVMTARDSYRGRCPGRTRSRSCGGCPAPSSTVAWSALFVGLLEQQELIVRA